jgi:two-component system, OmpR family, phosphate regulon sensor histidine kinase PhoR
MATNRNTDNTDEFYVAPKLISPVTITVSVLIVVSYLNGFTFNKNASIVYGVSSLLIIFALSHFVPQLKFSRSHAVYMYLYHLVLSFLLLFVVPTMSHFLYLWLLLMYLSEFYYQAKGFIISASWLLVVMIVGSLYQNDGISIQLLLHIFTEFAVILAINIIMTKLAFGNRKKRKELSNKIVKSEYEHGRLVALINSMDDAVIATDDKGNILTYNAAALDLLDTNMTLSNLKISDVMKLVDEKGQPIDALSLANSTSYLQRRNDLSIPLSKDEKVNLEMSISRISRSTLLAKQQGFTFLMRDITQQKSLDEERDLFISEVSHELRTPLTIAEGDTSMAVLMTEKPQPDIFEIKDSVTRAHEQIVFLSEMVNDLSALSRAQRTDKDMNVETFKVQEVLEELKTTYAPQVQKKNISFELIVDSAMPKLTTSRLYFREIMQNFITNAIKYTQQGGITVKCQVIDGNHIKVSVKDTGIGISKSEQAKVFEKFWRSEDPYTRSTSGTGLGLFITTKLAHRIGAQIQLESKINEGSTFSIVFPLESFKTIDHTNVVKNEVAHLFD